MSTVETQTPANEAAPFVDRRTSGGGAPQSERRQFSNSHSELSGPARELALAIDDYKLRTRRRFITYAEIYEVVLSLGYRLPSQDA